MKNYYLKTLSFLVAFVFVAGIAQAQVKFGIKAGVNFSSLMGFEDNLVTGDGEKMSTEMLVGYQGGLSLHIGMGSFFFQPELEYSLQGTAAKLESEADDEEIESENLKLHYIKLPMYLGYKYGLNMDSDILFGIGGYAGYLVSEDKFYKDLKLKSFDYGLSAMVGVDYVNMSFSLSYDLGLVDLIGRDGWSELKQEKDLSGLKNSCIKVSASYYF